MGDYDSDRTRTDGSVKILVIQIILPAVVTLAISEYMRKKKWIKPGDMKLDL